MVIHIYARYTNAFVKEATYNVRLYLIAVVRFFFLQRRKVVYEIGKKGLYFPSLLYSRKFREGNFLCVNA